MASLYGVACLCAIVTYYNSLSVSLLKNKNLVYCRIVSVFPDSGWRINRDREKEDYHSNPTAGGRYR